MPEIVSKPCDTHMLEMIPARPKTKKNPRRVSVSKDPPKVKSEKPFRNSRVLELE